MSERNVMTVKQHADQARVEARARGFADSIHYAPDWLARAETLYRRVGALGHAVPHFVGMLVDGRMVVIAQDCNPVSALFRQEIACIFEDPDRSQPLPPVSDEALAREMREARARLLTEIDRRDFGIDREPPDRSGNAAG